MKIKKSLVLIIMAIIISFVNAGCQKKDNEGPLTRTEFLMDTVITLKIYDQKDKKILDEAVDRLEEIESRMSTTIDTSDVSLINKNAGIQPVKVHEDVYYVIQQAKHFATITNGAYEPTIGPLVNLWNITGTDKDERDSIPSEKEIKKAMDLVNYKDLELMDDNQVYLKRKGMRLDLGGIVKGYAADELKRILLEKGVSSAIIDLGGNVYALGVKENGEAWRIGIQDPFEVTGNYLGILNVRDKSIVTSGDYERYFIYEGQKYHHIIDSKTGYPSENEVAGISIISDKSIDGDALSTALFVLGVDEGTRLVNTLEGIETIFITKQGEVFVNENIMEEFSLGNNKLKLIKNPN
ncbi:FAD:protein FMN transferase [Clostridium sp. Cult1]|jgi:thiamine biosynthesis lipoprotein|uniref:FAD:protein FMN transferase n=1 Tax=Clostridium sp. Cult1 TaxID=2079002 RepID=UPI001F3B0451|nr:FAD:protein FMN transferase [Clostridium sp. Cult1]MCF6463697.1 thiamine biosynthesis protein ApbE [Clostridium sp. Cult1]